MHQIDWFEIPSADFARASGFYETVFDCKLRPETMGPSRLGVFTTASGEGIGCVIQGDGYQPGGAGTVIYLNGGSSIDVVLARIEAAGGRIALGKTALPEGMGYFAHFIDTEGNRVGVHTM